MARQSIWWWAAPALLALGAGGALLVQRVVLRAAEGASAHEQEAKAEEAPSIARVRTARAIRESLSETIEGFGSASPRAGAVTSLMWPEDLAVERVLVAPGQRIEPGDPICKVRITPDAALRRQLLRQNAATADEALRIAHARLEANLGTKQDVLTAQAAADEAKKRVESASATAPPEDGLLRAASAGVVQIVRAQAGALAPAGTGLVDLLEPDAVVAVIGFEPAFAGQVTAGASVRLEPVSGAADAHWDATVSLVSPALNPATRLIDATAEFAGPTRPPAGLALRATLARPPIDALTVPRSAVLPSPDGDVVFVVKDGKASRRAISLGARTRDRAQALSGVAEGDEVIVLGHAQLEDGALVRAEEPR